MHHIETLGVRTAKTLQTFTKEKMFLAVRRNTHQLAALYVNI